MSSKDKSYKVLHVIYLFILALLLVLGFYCNFEFKNETIESYLFYGINGMGSSDYSLLFYGIKVYGLIFILIFILFYSLFYNIFKNKEYKFYPVKFIMNRRKLFTLILSIFIIGYLFIRIDLFNYIYNNFSYSTLFEDKYVDNKDILINNKKNLVLIYVESLETTLFSHEDGGDWDYNVIPELYDILNDKDSIYFASDSGYKGINNFYGTSWTTSSIISSSSGIPFKVPINNLYFNKDNILLGVNTLGDVLKNNGYHNEVISGAKTAFGGLYNYFQVHGNYDIIDPDTLDKYGYKMDKDDIGQWGFNDRYMFEVAKKRILEHVSNGYNFNETLIGIDSHPVDGYKAKFTLNKYDSQYENVYATESYLVNEFVKWIKSQDFYKDTVIVIMGDHLCMQTKFVNSHNDNNRGRYNVIINSSVKTDNNKNRLFTSMDMYPTILASIGAEIPNDMMGLGVNLFSDKMSLSEEMGIEKFEKKAKKNSLYYKNLLKE